MLDTVSCRQRQQRLLGHMYENKLDAVVVGQRHHVYYLAGALVDWKHQAGFLLERDGTARLIWPNEPPTIPVAADAVELYEANWHGTLRQDQAQQVAEQIEVHLKVCGAAKVGVDTSPVTAALRHLRSCMTVDSILWQMRRTKDADELALMRRAIACTERMHAKAREIIEPGLPELAMFSALHAAAVEAAEEPMAAMLGNDYHCGAAGGDPVGRKTAQSGELYVLDLGPNYRGYFADNCRTLSVDRKPTSAQQEAWAAISGCLTLFEQNARAGVRGAELYAHADAHLKKALGLGMVHHLGHGVGLEPHEYPHLNPRWNDELLVGEVVTAEPGVYGPHWRGGIRLENQYLVTATGVENLVDVPLGLV